MSEQERKKIKTNLHPKNKNREQYDLKQLIEEFPDLKNHIKPNKYVIMKLMI
jgi:23S rRNA (adenine1618-N6)-methyltransferase